MDGVAEYDVVDMTCTVNYSGNVAPSMTWLQDGVEKPKGVINNTVHLRSVTSSLKAMATKVNNGGTFSCTTNFSVGHRLTSTAVDNSFEYSYTWTSPTLNVLCTLGSYLYPIYIYIYIYIYICVCVYVCVCVCVWAQWNIVFITNSINIYFAKFFQQTNKTKWNIKYRRW